MTIDLQKEMQERAMLVQVRLGSLTMAAAEDSMWELSRLSATAGAEVVGTLTQRRKRPTANFFMGEGKVAELGLACQRSNANIVIFDNELSAVQVNNLDLSLDVKVIDRTELILQIFARRARSAEAQIQVELAQLQYLVSRVPVSAKQQRFKGGIGMKGPGESPFQLRGKPMRKRIKELKEKLGVIQQRRRRTRARRDLSLVSLVGYTNAGKSTLLNRVATAGAYVDDRLFATLDTTTRRVRLPNGNHIALTDTVGFIRNLPHGLVASFRSTLEQVAASDLLLLVADASNPHVIDHVQVVEETLADIGAANVPSLLILNKVDNKNAVEPLPELRKKYPGAICISALRGTGIDEAKTAIMTALWEKDGGTEGED